MNRRQFGKLALLGLGSLLLFPDADADPGLPFPFGSQAIANGLEADGRNILDARRDLRLNIDALNQYLPNPNLESVIAELNDVSEGLLAQYEKISNATLRLRQL